MYTIYTVITGSMTGIGAFIIYPMAKKFGIKNLTVAGYAIALFGSVLGWMFPNQLVLALIAGFLRQVGWLPNAYILERSCTTPLTASNTNPICVWKA